MAFTEKKDFVKHEKTICELQFAKDDSLLLACDESIVTVNFIFLILLFFLKITFL